MEGFVLVLLIGGFVALIINVNNKRRRLEEARSAYQGNLTRLKQDPTNADLRQKTLALGRIYSNLTRDKQGVTIFDEVALSNDINAACAAAVSHHARSAAPLQSADARLSRLAELHQKGLINDGELQEQRARILREL